MKSLLAMTFGILIGFVVATTVGRPAPLMAQQKFSSRNNKPPQAFLSGSERSLKLLEKISRQLETMDGRVKKIEAVIVKAGGGQ